MDSAKWSQILLEEFSPSDAAQYLLAQTGLSSISNTILAGTTGLALQALITGSVLQLVHLYFRRQARAALSVRGGGGGQGAQDPPLARMGVIWLTALICLHVVVVNVINARVVMMSTRFTAGYLMDFWLAQISNLIFAIVLLPVFIFFAFRVWNLWSRRKLVMALCVVSVVPAVGLGVAAAALGLQHPYPLQEIDNSAFAAWLPFVTMTINRLQWITLASSIAQFATACIFSSLICVGLFHHRACCSIMPGITGKIAFACGESLFPLVLTSGAILVGDILIKTNTYSIGPLITRAVHSCAPAIYFHCLMNSLTSAHRHRDNLRATVEKMAEDGVDVYEKGDPYANAQDRGAGQVYDPEDLDTPLQIEIHDHAHGHGGKSGLPKIITTSSAPKSAGAPSTGAGGFTAMTRPTFSIRSPFRSHSSSNVNVNAKGRNGPDADADQTLRSAGTGRRSSLAVAAANSTSPINNSGGLSIKLQNKLPVVSYRPAAIGRRESESIFVAHEEFEGLPTTPGDADIAIRLGHGHGRGSRSGSGSSVDLGDIDEGNDDGGNTPKYYTPPRLASPSPSPVGRTPGDEGNAVWADARSSPIPQARSPGRSLTPKPIHNQVQVQDNRDKGPREELRSPESVYEGQIARAF